jgi:Leucine-rich repeat (LRR) protein
MNSREEHTQHTAYQPILTGLGTYRMARNIEMKRPIVILLMILLGSTITVEAQKFWETRLDQREIYTDLKEAMRNPEDVYRLHLKKMKLDEIPKEVFDFPNLEELDISKNRFSTLPEEIGRLTTLKRLIAIKNKMKRVSPAIGELKNLKQLILNQNDLTTLPPEIGNCEELEYLDLWSNELSSMPKTMQKLQYLEEVDMRVIVFTPYEWERIKEALPDVQIHVSPGCGCGP